MPIPIWINFCLGSFKIINCNMKKNATTSPSAIATSFNLFSTIRPNSPRLSETVTYSSSPLIELVSPFENSISIMTAIMGPIEQSAISPKEFSLALRPPIVVDIPTPSAMINGTVIGPVVTPPESNDKGIKEILPFSISIAQTAKSIR